MVFRRYVSNIIIQMGKGMSNEPCEAAEKGLVVFNKRKSDLIHII